MKDSNDTGTISHEGIVQKVINTSVFVSIVTTTACSGCHAEGSCSLSGKQEKIIEIYGSYNVKAGDKVTVLMKQLMGYSALFLGYLLPGILVVAVLIIMISMKIQELMAGVISIAILIPYYLILYFLREQINKKFTFTLKV